MYSLNGGFLALLNENRAQAVIELSMVLSAAAIVIVLIYVFYASQINSATNFRDVYTANSTVQRIVNAANEVYSSGIGSETKILIEVPVSANLLDSNISGRTVLLKLAGGDALGTADVNILGSWKQGSYVYYAYLYYDGNAVRLSYRDFEISSESIYFSSPAGRTISKKFVVRNNSDSEATFWVIPNFYRSGVALSLDAGDDFFSVPAQGMKEVSMNFDIEQSAFGNYSGIVDVVGEISDQNFSKQVFVSAEIFSSSSSLSLLPPAKSVSAESGGSAVSSQYALCSNNGSEISGISWAVDGSADANAAPWLSLTAISNIGPFECLDVSVSVTVPSEVSAGTYDANFIALYSDKNSGAASISIEVSESEPPVSETPLTFYLSDLNQDYDFANWVQKFADKSIATTGELDWNLNSVADSNRWRDANLVAYYKFNGDAFDFSGRGNSGAVSSPIVAQGLWDANSYSFNGTADFVQLNNTIDDNMAGGFTVSAWVNMDSLTTGDVIISNLDGNNATTANRDGFFFRFFTDTTLQFYLFDSSTSVYISRKTAVNPISAGKWNHVVAVWDGTFKSSGMAIYVNGVRSDVADTNAGVVNSFDQSAQPLTMGKQLWTAGNLYFFSGDIDEVKIWDRALSASEVLADYNQWVNSNFVSENIIDAGADVDWNAIKINKDFDYNFGDELKRDSAAWGGNPVALWRMNNDVNDSSLNGVNDCSWVGTTTYETGLWSTNAASFNAGADINSYLELSAPVNNTLDVNNLTIEAWIYPISARTHSIFDNYYEIEGTDGGYAVWLSADNNITFGAGGILSNVVVSSPSNSFNLNEWSHIAVVRGGKDVNFYVNGVLNSSAVVGAGTLYYDTVARLLDSGRFIGHRKTARADYSQGGQADFNGVLEEVAVWGKALSAAEVSERYNFGEGAELVGNEPDLVSVWHFNGDAEDSAVGGNDGSAGGAMLTTGLWGTQAYSFDAENRDHVELNQGINFRKDLTIGAWVYPTSAREHGLIDNKYEIAGTDGGYAIWITPAGIITFGAGGIMDNVVKTSAPGAVDVNKWTQVVVVRNQGTVNIYSNGLLVGTGAVGTGLIYYDVGIGTYIGKRTEERTLYGQNGTAKFDGKIENMFAANYAMNQRQVMDLYRQGASRLDLNVYSCSDSACSTKTSNQYISGAENNSSIDISSLSNSRYLGFDVFFRPLSTFEGYTAGTFWIGAFLKDVNVSVVSS